MADVAFVALGSNLGDRDAHLAYARRAIAALPETRLLAESAVEETEPLGELEQPRYLNQMLAVETALSPRALLDHLQRIEGERGRTRAGRWGSRTLDLDLVRMGAARSDDASLTLPHPGLGARDFWAREEAALARTLAALERATSAIAPPQLAAR